jgi:hypothetical protein
MKLDKNTVIEKLLRRIGFKTKAVAIVEAEEPMPRGVVLVCRKVAPKPRPRVAPKAVTVRKYPDLKVVAVSREDKAKVKALLESDPGAALKLNNSLNANVRRTNAPVLAYNNLTELEREQKEDREKTIVASFDTITRSLPTTSEAGIGNDMTKSTLLWLIGKKAFESALMNDVLFTADEYFNASITVGAVTIKLDLKDRELIDKSVGKLKSWSGAGKVLADTDTWEIIRSIGSAARQYQVSQSKKKNSEYYLELLVSTANQAEINAKREALISDYLAALCLEVSTIAVKIGFTTNKSRSAFFTNSSDSKFGLTEICKKDMLGYMERITDGCKISGKLTGANMPKDLMNGTLNYLTR